MARKTYKKVIVTPELLAQVNPKNIELRDLFLKEKNAPHLHVFLEFPLI